MPERITRFGIQHVPRRRRLRPGHPALTISIAVAGLVLSTGFLYTVTLLARLLPQVFPYLCVGTVLLVLIGASLIPVIQARH